MDKYEPKKIEAKWQKYWDKNGTYKDYGRKKRFYALDMFPYPSGAGLHVGHPKGYIATDTFSRYKILQGYSVIHPMGWDAFGLPAENFAIKNKTNPNIFTAKSVAIFKKQLEKFGFTYDWDREINTTDPGFYKWTQWIFTKLFEKGLAYESNEPINWCPSCKTGLSNEDLEDGKCERCGSEIEQKPMRQWVLKMTDYADRLLYDLDSEDLDWEDMIVEQQRNWIGRSEGVQFELKISGTNEEIEVYTTRIDTVFGMTYVVVAPEHKIIEKIKDKIENYPEIEEYILRANKKTALERTELQKEKTGVEIKGVKIINPFNQEELSLFVADYVIGGYGTGAVMAVPAHDERDFEFAKKYNLPIKGVIFPEKIDSGLMINDIEEKFKKFKEKSDKSILDIWKGNRVFTEDGVLWDNSKNYFGLTSQEARKKMTAWLEKNKLGQKKVNYKMRDWVFSRQRYWGEPIPIIHCEKCGAVAVPENQLPVILPEVENYEPTGTGESPLASITDWVNTTCPKCGGKGKRETNTMPQWAGSSWYYLRYIDPKNSFALVDKDLEKKWMPVDLYVGGAEHATRHLLYARFWHKFLFDIGAVSTKEPFKRLVHVGLILAEDGKKMSKRWGNVVNPDDIISQFGADAIRVYEMFMGPFTQSIAWSTKGVVGTKRFLEKVWKIQEKISEQEIVNNKLNNLIHKTIKKVGEDIENFRFNTAISALMILANEMEKQSELSITNYQLLITLLSPFAPHLAEELWRNLGNKKSIFQEAWPAYDLEMIKDEEIELIIQINGKVRDKIIVSADISEDEAKKIALEREKVKNHIAEKEIRKNIFVKGRLINIVISL
ncbi:MAG: leucine--tRNA ligase [Candidatus Moranbacteria bacterium RIFOXYA12_FULL_35_19]|nr:MAG: Leucine-tRNA ligase [Candidatus Moranbacteria bacterium GW2011_GWF2_35_39]OGI31181.1 MAG: leucine--tRNA ligase [Candidatus Moranbacteria bacterium RIFOXYB12_FULL_35_8]OGI32759.1 MAG: leucine--tRNA ligase [Candidatus Moranbacteria bacterium RIFOXYC12_FULL_36_13]OGI35176.1 MAG: leucine--tRNA ligase [Candidatus Moranbacteria bacterium RIFOXYA12_FULL_35_19]